jgi:hypothetical protein
VIPISLTQQFTQEQQKGRRSRRRSRTGALFAGPDRGPFKPVHVLSPAAGGSGEAAAIDRPQRMP